jgi:hypothetical protein
MALRPYLLAVASAVAATLLLAACSSGSSSGADVSSSPIAPSASPVGASTSPSPAASPSGTVAPAKKGQRLKNGDFNSCSVVTQAEASSALGQSVGGPVLGSATVEGGLACVFYGPDANAPHEPSAAQPDTVRVVVVEGSDAKKWYDDYKSKVPAKAISGYGDEAFWDGGASLSVLSGQDYLRIAVIPNGAPPSLSSEEQLAKAILPSL